MKISILIYIACIAVLASFLFKSRRKYKFNQIITFDEDVTTKDMSEEEFKEYCRELLEKRNYEVELIDDDRANFIGTKDDVKYIFKCHFGKEPAEIKIVSDLDEAKGAYGCHVAVAMTNKTFPTEVISMATLMGIVLWDGKKLK